jgi:hypothetical protein
MPVMEAEEGLAFPERDFLTSAFDPCVCQSLVRLVEIGLAIVAAEKSPPADEDLSDDSGRDAAAEREDRNANFDQVVVAIAQAVAAALAKFPLLERDAQLAKIAELIEERLGRGRPQG